ncbi:hypothetical protein GCM10023186_42280 [Hymenobacter koreensis]|uniref:Uncharacterized protein n=1 Tax=Hymenobacter koreensis TaxID=1084523 RepID=A0ABP8JK41_9BACT
MNTTFEDVEAFRFQLGGSEFINLTLQMVGADLKGFQLEPGAESSLLATVHDLCQKRGHAYPNNGAWATENDWLIVYDLPSAIKP